MPSISRWKLFFFSRNVTRLNVRQRRTFLSFFRFEFHSCLNLKKGNEGIATNKILKSFVRSFVYAPCIKLPYRMYQNTSTVRKSIISIESTVVCSTAVNKLRTCCENKRDSFDRSLSKGNLYSVPSYRFYLVQIFINKFRLYLSTFASIVLHFKLLLDTTTRSSGYNSLG